MENVYPQYLWITLGVDSGQVATGGMTGYATLIRANFSLALNKFVKIKYQLFFVVF